MVAIRGRQRFPFAGGQERSVDGQPFDPAQTLNCKGLMSAGRPNFASCFGGTNAPPNGKADLSREYLCRLLSQLRGQGVAGYSRRGLGQRWSGSLGPVDSYLAVLS